MDSFAGSSGIQRRLTFAATVEPIVCSAYLTGLLVAIDTDAHRRGELAGVLEAIGVEADAHEHHGLTFPVSRLYRAASLPDTVAVTIDTELEVLWQLAVRYGAGQLDTPATLHASAGRLLLRWEATDGDDLEGVLTAEAAGALLHSQLPFVASADAWELASQLTRMPLQVATLRQHRDGHIEVRAVRPQQAESAPIPGLWKIDQTTYGAPLPYAERLNSIVGLAWQDSPPTEPSPLTLPPDLVGRLDGHVAEGARQLAQLVRDYGSAVVAWPSGLGRRVAALAAVRAVDGLPVQILCPPWAVWSWLASLSALGLDDDEQARIVTWASVAAGAALHATPSVIVDDFTGADALAAAPTLRRLDTLEGVNRIGVCATWPSDPGTLLTAMHLVRPGEFPAASAGALLRYPLWPVRRANEHADAYRIPMPALAAGRPYRRRFDVRTVALSAAQRRQVAEQCASGHDAAGPAGAALVEQLRQLTSAGSAQALSAKVSQVAGQARQLLDSGTHVVVVARHQRTLDLISTLVRQPGSGRLATAIWAEADQHSWAEDRFDTALVCDYPDRPGQLWGLVGYPGDDDGAAVLLWHTQRSVDDELAVSSSRGVAPSAGRIIQSAVRGVGEPEDETHNALW
jgi:hypothetical protein